MTITTNNTRRNVLLGAAAASLLPVAANGMIDLAIANDSTGASTVERAKNAFGVFHARLDVTSAMIPATIDAIETQGYSAAGDDGGGRYQRVGGEPLHAGKVQSADGAWWGLVEQPVVNVKQLGAKGDGTTDDSTAIQDAVDYAKTKAIRIVRMPSGTFAVDSQINLPADIELVGTPNGTKMISGASLPITDRIIRTATNSGIADTLYNGRIAISGIEFDNQDRAIDLANRAGTVWLANCQAVISHCKFHSTNWIPLCLVGTHQSLVEHCEFYDGGNRTDPIPTSNNPPAIFLGKNSLDNSRSVNPTVFNCYFHDWRWSPIYAFQTGGNILNCRIEDVYETGIWGEDTGDVDEWVIQGNRIKRVRWNVTQASGIEILGGDKIWIEDNTIEDCDLSGIFVSGCKELWVKDNSIADCITSTGINKSGDAQWGQLHLRSLDSGEVPESYFISGNRIRDTRGTKIARYGIRVRLHAGASKYDGLTLTDNDVKDSGLTSNVRIDEGALEGNFVIRGNRGFDDIRNAPIAWGGDVSHTGDEVETTLAMITIPGGSMGPNGALRITFLYENDADNSGSTTFRWKIGSASYYHVTHSNRGTHGGLIIQNAGAEDSQVSQPSSSNTGWVTGSGPPMAGGMDTAVDVDLTFTVQVGSAGDTARLRSYRVELIRSP